MLIVNSPRLCSSLLRAAICAALLLGISEIVDSLMFCYLKVDLDWSQLFLVFLSYSSV